ncbi:MAG: hypothetical protein H6Q05_3922 [Acidobacteria bacterium]|nr:hypothetical protein [Acidobacteriota bacterium]
MREGRPVASGKELGNGAKKAESTESDRDNRR